jgi:hypothetical protein
MVYWLWRAGAEQEGEEEEGHFRFLRKQLQMALQN